jgi:hypothetical protein
MKQQVKKFSILIVSAFLFSACLKDTIEEVNNIKGVTASPEFSAPLISSSLGMAEIYKSYSDKAIIQEKSDKSLVFIFQSRDTVAPTQFVQIPPMPFDFAISMPAQVIALFDFQGRFDLAINDSVVLPSANNERIKLINVKNGRFALSFSNGFKHDAVVKISYPTMKKNGIAISDSFFLAPAGNNPTVVNRIIDLSNYDIDFTRDGITYNTLPFEYEISLIKVPGNTTNTTDEFKISQNFEIGGYNIIKGYLGKFEIISADEETEIDIFDNGLAGEFFLNDPRLTIKLYNTFGVPVTGKITNLRVVDQNGSDFPVIINPFQDTFSFASPSFPGELAVSEFKIDKTNSNIDDAINIKPKFIKFTVKFDANYNDVVIDNYLVDTAMFVIDFNSEVPLDFKIINYVTGLKQTNGSFGDLPANIQNVILDIKVENTLPFDLVTQMVFTDDSIVGLDTINVVRDSLFSTPLIIQGAIVDADGKVVLPSMSILNVSLTKEKYDRIQKAGFNSVNMKINSSQFLGQPGFVKIYTDQKMNLKIGGKVKIKY